MLTINRSTFSGDITVSNNGSTSVLIPRQTGSRLQYSVPQDGYVLVKVAFDESEETVSHILRFELPRPDRIVAVDPILATRLDLLLDGNADRMSPRALQRRYFADFTEDTPDAQPQAVRVPA